MTDEPLVFIILVNWNGKEETIECIQSLQKLSYRNYRIIVVDNASTDDSVPTLREAFPGVVVLGMQQNLRFAGGNNAGMQYALEHGAELLLVLNNDTTVDRESLSYLVTRFRSDPRTGMVSPKIYYYDDPERIWFAGGVISMWTGIMKHTGIREIDSGQFDASRIIDYATGCCVLTSRSVVERVGRLDESYYMYSEDADWSMRVRKAGYVIAYEPRAKLWHKLSVSAGGHLSWYKMRNKFISNFRFFLRYAAWYQLLVFPWMSVLMNVQAALKYLLTTRR